MNRAVLTITSRTMGTRVAKRSPILTPITLPPTSRRNLPKSDGTGPQKVFTVVAYNGGAPYLTKHNNLPAKLMKLPHDAERLTGRVVQHRRSHGYIVEDKTKETLFYHISAVDLNGYIRFPLGQRVTFTLTKFGDRTVAGVVRPMVQQYKPAIEIDLATGAVIKPQVAHI